ncbi:MAG: LamG-like jellyroll fold domain-containing protein [Planctomycetota bacterium]
MLSPALLLIACSLQQAPPTTPASEPVAKRGADDFRTNRQGAREVPLTVEEDAFTFVVYGDRTGGPADGVKILAEAVTETNLLGPDLVMTVGDLVQGYNERPEWLTQMREYRDIMDRLDCRWFPVAGNHDVYWRGDGERPAAEHEGDFEAHFGPLWYAFRHKTAWFIVLYTDEPNPATGERNFSKPESQRMSPEQFTWLAETLEHTRSAEHVFVFCHHPRWTEGNYGDDWRRVHALLVAAGNVTAVFGGHIHRMRYDPQDGIEYFAVATIGGAQSGSVPEAGFLHCYDVVTVRKGGIDHVTYPVGSGFDPRTITGEVSLEAPKLTRVEPFYHARPTLSADGAVAGAWRVRLANPTSRPAELTLTPTAKDGRWTLNPARIEAVLAPGEQRTFDISAARRGPFDAAFDVPELALDFRYLAETRAFTIPTRRVPLDLDTSALDIAAALPAPEGERALELSGGAYVGFPAAEVALPDGPFTLETWVRAERFASRQGLVAKTEGSEYSLFANDGKPSFSVHLSGAYVEVSAETTRLEAGRWQHVAGVFDGQELRLYVDGALVAKRAGAGPRKTNELPLIVGGDVSKDGGANSCLDGALDEVRLSTGARYTGERFTPSRRHAADTETVLLLHMDGALGPWLFDSSARGRRATLRAGARIADQVVAGAH